MLSGEGLQEFNAQKRTDQWIWITGVQTGRNIANQFVGEQFNFCLFVCMSSSGSAFFTFHCHFMFHLFIFASRISTIQTVVGGEGTDGNLLWRHPGEFYSLHQPGAHNPILVLWAPFLASHLQLTYTYFKRIIIPCRKRRVILNH